MKFNKPDLARLVKLIYSADNFEKLFALVGLRKLLSIENDPPIQLIIDAGLISTFVELLHHEIPKYHFEAAWCLTNIASGKTEHVYALIEHKVIGNFVQLLNSPVPEVVDQAVWGLGNIAGDNIFARDQVMNTECMPHLCQLMVRSEPDHQMTRNCTWTVSNLCRGKPRPRNEVLLHAVGPLGEALVNNT
mgnify:CR=1 FL=1